MSDTRHRTRRRQWIVNRPLQGRFVRTLLFIICVLAAATLVGLYLALWLILVTYDLQRDKITVLLFENIGLLATVELLICLPLLIWILVWTGIRWTHKVAGPLVRIMVAIEQMTHGNFDVHLVLRKHDGLQDLAEDINRLAASLRNRFPSGQ